jgi:hypothetical protein
VKSEEAEGKKSQVHPDVKRLTLEGQKKARTIEELERQLMGPPVVATTCLSIDQLSCLVYLLVLRYLSG